MKRIHRFMMVAFAATAAMTACQQDNLEPETGKNPETVQVLVTIGDQTKGFTDLAGVTWEVGDQIKYAGGVELTSEALKAENISSDGCTATFTFPAALNEVDRTGWFVSTKCHPGNYTEVEFTLGADNGNALTQDVAGEMNKRYLFLHSGTGLVSVKAGEAPKITMDIAGTVFRFIPYTTQYNDESVLSVKMASKTNLVGTVSYDRGGNSYRGVTDINWKAYNTVSVNLGTAFSLEGVSSAENSKGIYMAVAATKADVPLDGYQYVVETDKATYTFDAMDKTLAVGENVVKNVMLNLDKATRLFEGGELQYVGDLGNAANTVLPAEGVSGFDGGYWYAQVMQTGSTDWESRDGAENAVFYSGVDFAVTDAATGAPVDWLNVTYGGNGGSHWMLTAAANTGAERSAVITATFPNVKGYVVTDACKTRTVTVTQADVNSKKSVKVASTSLPASFNLQSTQYTDQNVGYCLFAVNGVEDRDWSNIYSRVTFKCVSEADAAAGNYANEVGWLSCRYATNDSGIFDCVWWVNADANEGTEPRTAVIVALFPDDDKYEFPEPTKLVITQAAGQDLTVYDPASSANMWNTMTVEEMFYYYAPGWSQIENPSFTADGNNYKISLPVATGERWQAQVAFRTDMTSSSSKTYDFYCVLNSSQNIAGATIKLVKTGDDGNYYFDVQQTLVAGTDLVFKMSNMAGRDMDKISLFFDFGGNPANTEVTVRDIIFQEHQEK